MSSQEIYAVIKSAKQELNLANVRAGMRYDLFWQDANEKIEAARKNF